MRVALLGLLIGGAALAEPVTTAEVRQALDDGRVRTAARLAAQALNDRQDATERAELNRLRGEALLAAGQPEEALTALATAAGTLGMEPALLTLLAAAAEAAGLTPQAAAYRAALTDTTTKESPDEP